jgi:hypothetical protein
MTGTASARLPGPVAPAQPHGPARALRVRRVLTSPLATAIAAVAALAGGASFGVARAVADACVHLDGTLATIGLRLALVQDVADCPTGTLALVPAPSQGVVLVAALALPVLAAASALGAVLATLAAAVLRAARTARDVLAAAVRTLPRASAVAVTEAPAALVRTAGHPRPAALARALHPHRGPPVALA